MSVLATAQHVSTVPDLINASGGDGYSTFPLTIFVEHAPQNPSLQLNWTPRPARSSPSKMVSLVDIELVSPLGKTTFTLEFKAT
jgi:hypothetical protein